MVASVAPFAVRSGEGTPLATPTGDSVCIKAHTGNTNGSLSVLELVIQPKSGPALHLHHREDELWYVLEGDFRFKAGDALFRVSTGGMAFGPRGTPHCFQNVGDAPGRFVDRHDAVWSGAVLRGVRRAAAGTSGSFDALRRRARPWGRVRRSAGRGF